MRRRGRGGERGMGRGEGGRDEKKGRGGGGRRRGGEGRFEEVSPWSCSYESWGAAGSL